MIRLRLLLLLLVATLGTFALTGVGPAFAGITFDASPGTNAPPATPGPYAMSPFRLDARPLYDFVTGVAGPTGNVAFSPELQHVRVSDGWNTWSHGYAGD